MIFIFVGLPRNIEDSIAFIEGIIKKHNAIVINHKIIPEAQKKLNIPICIIGGIDKLNLMDVKKYKPDMISMISGIFQYENPGREIKEMMRLIEE